MLINKIILGSKSPRRQALIKEIGLPVEIRIKEVDELYPENLKKEDVPAYLAELKASPLLNGLSEVELLITSDTIVLFNGQILGKPKDAAHSIEMLVELSGNFHDVITGVHLHSKDHFHTFSTRTRVYFSQLSKSEINYYVEHYQPFDKAGSYGIQEWIGYIGVSKIEGCYYNVMGLPMHDLYHALKTEFGISTL